MAPNSYGGYGSNDNGRGNAQHDNGRGGPRDEAPRPDRDGDGDRSKLLPEDTYQVRAIKHRWGYTNGKTPLPQIGVLLSITDGPHKGRTLLYYGNFHENSKEITIKALRALGWIGEDPSNMDSLYNGVTADAVVEHDEYDGKWRAKVKWINNADVVMKNEMTPGDLKAFAAQFRGLFRQNPGSGSAPASSSSSGGSDDFGGAYRDEPPSSQRSFGDNRDNRDPPRDERRDDRGPPPGARDFGRDDRAPAGRGGGDSYQRPSGGGERWGGDVPPGDPPYARGRG